MLVKYENVVRLVTFSPEKFEPSIMKSLQWWIWSPKCHLEIGAFKLFKNGRSLSKFKNLSPKQKFNRLLFYELNWRWNKTRKHIKIYFTHAKYINRRKNTPNLLTQTYLHRTLKPNRIQCFSWLFFCFIYNTISFVGLLLLRVCLCIQCTHKIFFFKKQRQQLKANPCASNDCYGYDNHREW